MTKQPADVPALNLSSKAAVPLESAPSLSRKALRQHIRATRRALSSAQQQIFSQQACQQLITLVKQLKVSSVALYLTNDGELDTTPLIEQLWQLGVQTYLPRLHPFSKGNLLFFRYTETTLLIKNRLQIWEPKLDITQMRQPEQIDLIITPLVAFDKEGNRMGMGGGFYDRTLANWKKNGKPYPIGYAHDCQQVDKLPVEYWDIPLPMIVTPTTIVRV